MTKVTQLFSLLFRQKSVNVVGRVYLAITAKLAPTA